MSTFRFDMRFKSMIYFFDRLVYVRVNFWLSPTGGSSVICCPSLFLNNYWNRESKLFILLEVLIYCSIYGIADNVATIVLAAIHCDVSMFFSSWIRSWSCAFLISIMGLTPGKQYIVHVCNLPWNIICWTTRVSLQSSFIKCTPSLKFKYDWKSGIDCLALFQMVDEQNFQNTDVITLRGSTTAVQSADCQFDTLIWYV